MHTRKLKYRDESWDFQYVDTKEYTHCFHTYPAMMIPQIARKLLKEYGVENGWLLDPYCGTGTSLVIAGQTSTTMHEENIVVCQRTTHTCL